MPCSFCRNILGVLTSITLLSVSVAQADSVTTTIHHQYQAPRALGMGDAFVAVANDYTAIFYNPAALARRDSGQINGSIGAGLSPGIADFFKKFSDISATGGNQIDYLNLIHEHYGDVFSTRLNLFEAEWVRPKWGIALVPMDFSLEMAMHQLVGPTINSTVYADTTLAMAYAGDLPSFRFGRMSWGITGKLVNRGYFSKSISAIDLASSNKIVDQTDLLEGYTIDADLGTLWTPELPDQGIWSVLRLARPSFAAVVRNIGEVGFGQSLKIFNKTNQISEPEKLYRVVDLGTRWEYPSMWIFGGRGVLDIRDLNHPDFSWRKSLHLGFEFDWTMTSWWKGQYRFGMSQGFWTAGLSAELGIFNLDLVSYADDVGSQNRPIENRSYALRMNLDF